MQIDRFCGLALSLHSNSKKRKFAPLALLLGPWQQRGDALRADYGNRIFLRLDVGNKGGRDFFAFFLRQTTFLTPVSDFYQASRAEPASKVPKTEISFSLLSWPSVAALEEWSE